jgi:hypothetical protein
MVGVASDVAGVAERSNERDSTIDTGGHTQEVVVGEVTDDDVARVGQRSHRPDIRAKMCGSSLFDQPRRGPVMPGETPFEVATTDEEQPSVDPGVMKSAAGEFGNGTRSGPLVGKDDQTYPHRQSIAEQPPVEPWQRRS